MKSIVEDGASYDGSAFVAAMRWLFMLYFSLAVIAVTMGVVGLVLDRKNHIDYARRTLNQAPTPTPGAISTSSDSSFVQIGMNNVLRRAVTVTATPMLRNSIAGARSFGHGRVVHKVPGRKRRNGIPGQGGSNSSNSLGLVAAGTWLSAYVAGEFYTGGKLPEVLFNKMSEMIGQGSSSTKESTAGTAQASSNAKESCTFQVELNSKI